MSIFFDTKTSMNSFKKHLASKPKSTRLSTLDDIQKSHEIVAVSRDKNLLVARKKKPRIPLESFSQHLCNVYYEMMLEDELALIQKRIPVAHHHHDDES